MKTLIGKTLGRYEIIDLLGEGGMGTVFRARDVTLRRDVAIKVMHPQYIRQQDFRQRFLQEAQTAARLDHASIVPVYDFGQQEDLLYIVMKFVPGDNLQQLLKDMRTQKQWIPLDETLQVVIQVCQALDYAHRHGVLHRDIKPANIMLEPEPCEGLPFRPVLTDLGLAKLAEGGLETQTGTSMGTPAYMSPEQAMGNEIDSRSDVYSLGILLYELAVGRLPFQIRTITEAIRCHTQEPPPPPRSLRPELPEFLETIILKALEKDPANRYVDAAGLAHDLKEIAPSLTDVVGPTVMEESVSLMTQYQQSLLVQRRASLFREFPVSTEALGQDCIQIIDPDKTSRTIQIEKRVITVGRDPENDIVLKDDKVSREHARIELKEGQYWITDLNSTNGTLIGHARLLANVPEGYSPGATLRMGDTFLMINLAQEQAEPPPSQDKEVASPADETERIGLHLENAQLAVEPGRSVNTTLSLHNQGKLVDTFHINAHGLPDGWVKSVEPVYLMNGERRDVTLTIYVPRQPQSRAGRYPFTIKVTSQDDPNQSKEIKATLTVAAYSEYKSSLYPQKVRAGESARVTVENLGNCQQAYNLTWQDRGDELAFSPPRSQLRVVEGQSAATEFRAEPRKKRWIGGEKSHTITAQISTTAGNGQSLSGEVISRGLIPAPIGDRFIAKNAPRDDTRV
jgi:serine/threonine protein kinase